jgi:molybdopterin adenylyltransferase
VTETIHSGTLLSLNLSAEKGISKSPVDKIVINQHGMAEDAHAGQWHRQVSVMAWEDVEGFASKFGRSFKPGEFAENLTTKGIDLAKVAPLDRFRCGEVELEVTQIGKSCHGSECAIFQDVGACVMPKKGIFCRVINGGTLRTGDSIEHVVRPLRISVMTVSDRASIGIYKDQSGPLIRELIKEHFNSSRWELDVTSVIFPDDRQIVRQGLIKALNRGTDIIFTTGGTGVGPRDITVDEVLDLTSRTVPGIMEFIRVKYGANNPNALLSRGIVAVKDDTIIYTLPGSPRAAKEYMTEILRTLEHLILMVHGLGH